MRRRTTTGRARPGRSTTNRPPEHRRDSAASGDVGSTEPDTDAGPADRSARTPMCRMAVDRPSRARAGRRTDHRQNDDDGATPPGVTPSRCLGGAAQRAATCLASADLRFAAWLRWMTPLLAALSSCLDATTRAAAAASLSPAAIASRTCRTCVFSSDLTALLRRRAFSFVRIRLIWDLMFATCVLELFRWFARAIGLRRRGCRRCVAETDTRVGSLWASAFALCGHAEPTANPTGKNSRSGRSRGVGCVTAGRAARSAALPLPQRQQRGGDGVVGPAVQARALAPHRVRGEVQDAVEADLGLATLAVPRTPPDVEPVTTPARLLLAVPVVVLRRRLQPQVATTVPGDHENRPVLAAPVVLVVGHPRPDQLPGIGLVVGLRGVLQRRQQAVVD